MKHEVTIRFQHVDGAGILYFSRAFELCHEALEELLLKAGYPLREILSERDWVMPIVHAESDYRRPMLLGDKINISVSLSWGGGSSLRFHYAMADESGEIRAEVDLVHVVLSKKTFKPVEISPAFLDALKALDVGLD